MGKFETILPLRTDVSKWTMSESQMKLVIIKKKKIARTTNFWKLVGVDIMSLNLHVFTWVTAISSKILKCVSVWLSRALK